MAYNHSFAAINAARRTATAANGQNPRYGFLKLVEIVLGKPHPLAPRWRSEIGRLTRAQWAELWSIYEFNWPESTSAEDCSSAYEKAYGWA